MIDFHIFRFLLKILVNFTKIIQDMFNLKDLFNRKFTESTIFSKESPFDENQLSSQ